MQDVTMLERAVDALNLMEMQERLYGGMYKHGDGTTEEATKARQALFKTRMPMEEEAYQRAFPLLWAAVQKHADGKEPLGRAMKEYSEALSNDIKLSGYVACVEKQMREVLVNIVEKKLALVPGMEVGGKAHLESIEYSKVQDCMKLLAELERLSGLLNEMSNRMLC
jgi:hypothetical protein